jgi:outer membrane biosynthesis protein TonB
MNKKKISIVIISVLAFIIILCVALFLYSKNNQNLESSNLPQNEVIPNDVVENTTDIQTAEVQEEKSISNEDENQKEINTSIVQEEKEDSKNVAEASSKTSSKKTNTKSIESKAKNTQTETKKTETPKQVENTTTTTTIIETPKKEEIKEDQKPSQSAPSTNTEKYVKNDAMINKIKNVIQNNESDFMKQYGYNIVVDSSIKAQTNQFTYTENRVKSYITYKFGTIRIYAEDYYVNGNLIMTECYIL